MGNEYHFRTMKQQVIDETSLSWGSDLAWSSEIVDATEVEAGSGAVSPSNGPAVGDGLIHHYTFDGGAADDQVGTSDGTVSGATYSSLSGPAGYGSFSFDGVNDFIDLGTLDLSTGSGFSLSVWVYRAAGASNRFIFGHEYSGSDDLRVSDKGVGFDDGSGELLSLDGVMQDETWHHYVVTHDVSSNEAVLYLDAVTQQTGSIAFDYAGAAGLTHIANRPGNSGSDEWMGNIGSVRIYDRQLASSEVEDIWNAERP